jgi:uncharacterized protein
VFVTVEPRVEDLLASIRKAIDDDLGGVATSPSSKTSGNSQGTLMRGALREMRVNFDSSPSGREQADGEIAQLRERIGRSRSESAFELRPPAPKPHVPRASLEVEAKRSNIGRILTGEHHVPPRSAPILRQTYIDDLPPEPVADYEAAPEYVQDYQEQQWEEAPSAPPPDYYQPTYAPQPPQNALVSPSTAYAAQNSFQQLTDALMTRAAGERGLEGMTQDLLRGMLKQWLDDNLPQMVEKLVREEIERVARRGR